MEDKETKGGILAEQPEHQEETVDKETCSAKSPIDVADEMKRLTKENDILLQLGMGNSVKPESVQDVLSDYKREIQKLKNAKNTLSNRLDYLSKRVGVALSRELSKSPEEEAMESVPTSSKAIWEPEAFRDVTEDTKTIEEVLHEYQEKLKTMLQAKQVGEDGSLYDSNSAKVEEIVAEVLREQESEPVIQTQLEPQLHSDRAPVEEFICGFEESDAINLYEVSPQIGGEDDAKTAKKDREQLKPEDTENLDEYLMSLRDLITVELQTSLCAEQEPQHMKRDQENTEEVIVKVEAPPHEEHFNAEYLETLFSEDFSLFEVETDHCEASDTLFAKTLPENETEQEDRLINEPMTMLEGLSLVENDTPVTQDDQSKKESFEQKFRDFEKKLEEERKMKEKYERDVQDLLNDIVEIKMKQAQDVDDDPELMRKKMKEEIELKQDNKRLQDDLSQERKRRMSLEESKRDLLDEVDRLMKDKETFKNEEENNKDNEKAFQEMINQRKTIGELNKINKQLNKENEELKEALKDTEHENKNQKKKLLANFEEEREAMRKESMTGKSELEIQLQELLVMNDDLKRNIKDLHEELNGANMETHEERRHQDEKKIDTARNPDDGDMDLVRKTQEDLQQTLREKEESLEKERRRNDSLKDQLNDAEDALKQTITKYQIEIDSLETEKAKTENELHQENSILTNKLEIEKAAAEQQRQDFEEILRREKDHLKEDIMAENERSRKRMHNVIEDRMEDLKRQERKYVLDMQELERQYNMEKDEMTQIYMQEKKKLKEAFDEELDDKLKESNRKYNEQINKMRDEFEREKNDMTHQLDTEKLELQESIERKIYEQLLRKNISVESDFQEALASILQEQTKEIEGVESEIRDAEERFQEDKIKLMEESNSEKERLKKNHQKEKQALESTIQNLLKEVVKLKHQRKEMRAVHKKEKENMDDIFERERMQLREEWERYKKELLDKLQEDFDNKLANEAVKFEASLDELKQQLIASEQRRGEVEERLREMTLEKEHKKFSAKEKGDKTGKQRDAELKAMKKNMEEEYEMKLKEEKRKFEETLQALRREIGSLQEKRRLIQDKVYNQDSSMVDRQVIEKSIANYKKEFLLKMEEEMAERITRERKPLEETINELEREIEELKRQRWELRNQLRRERAKLEEEFELERERMESIFLKEKEELKTRIEVTIQKEMMKRTMDERANRALSLISNETLCSPQTSPRRLRSENTSLRQDNDRLASEVERLTTKLDTLESNFQGIISSEKIKAERIKQIQAKIPKKVTFSDEMETRRMDYSRSGEQNEQLLQALKERESQVTQLVEAKRFYEEMISELCEEAGLFELDQNVAV